MNGTILSFTFFLAIFAGIGMFSAIKQRGTTDDYLLASRDVHPWMAALSAVATNNSGFMFIGLIGMCYTLGISGAWIMVGWVIGDLLMWNVVHHPLRRISEDKDASTFSTLLGSFYPKTAGGTVEDDRDPEDKDETLDAAGDAPTYGNFIHKIYGHNLRPVTRLSALMIVIFLGSYASAQLTAGSKALQVLLGWPFEVGAIIGAVIVLAYCFSGGIRASIWTDVAQSLVMIVAMALLFSIGIGELGGISELWSSLTAIDPNLVNWVPQDVAFGPLLFIVGWFFAGMGVIGQPHIMVRFMAIDKPESLNSARWVYMIWYTLFSVACVLVGLLARVLLQEGSLTELGHQLPVGVVLEQGMLVDPEFALPALSTALLPEVLVGLVLAGLFAATMSTADSQVLSCSAALTQDLFPKWSKSYTKTKMGTVLVTAIALSIALLGSESVFSLVALAWSVLAASFGPLLLVHMMEHHSPSRRMAIAMMLTGLFTVLIWKYVLGFSDAIYEAMPGMLMSWLVYAVVTFARHKGLKPA